VYSMKLIEGIWGNLAGRAEHRGRYLVFAAP
jgi:hypothetical protein